MVSSVWSSGSVLEAYISCENVHSKTDARSFV